MKKRIANKRKKQKLIKEQKNLVKELNKTIQMYERSNIQVPKIYKDQMNDLKRNRFKVEKRGMENIKNSVSILKQTIDKSEISTEEKRKEFLDKFKREIAGTEMRKDGTRRKYDIEGSLFRNEMKDYINNINIGQLLRIYDIINKMETDKRFRYGKYKSGDFDAMVVTASKGYDPTKMSIDEFLDHVYDIEKIKERELDKQVLSQAPKTNLFD